MLFSEEAIGFLFENHTRDSKDWFKEHKADYHRLIEEPFAELITALTPIMNDIDSRIVCNPKKISRLYKDARYNKGGPIFRESVWCSLKCQRDKSEYHPMPEFYFYISTHGFGYGCGYYKTDRESMDEMRAMILAGVPVYSLLREKTGMLETEGFQMKSEIFVMKIPLLWEVKEFPFSAAFGAAVVVCIHFVPSRLCLWGIPDNLRIRTNQEIFAPSLQLFSAGSIDYFVFFPAICYPHIYIYLVF